MTLPLVQISAGHRHSSSKDNSTPANYLTLARLTHTCSVITPKAPFVRKDLQPGPHTHCVKQSLIHPHVGPGTGPQSPIEASSLAVVSPFGAFHVLPHDKTPSGPFQTMKEERQRSRPLSSQKILLFLRIFTHLLLRKSSVLYQVLGESFYQNLKW